jgi:hypothetical protein
MTRDKFNEIANRLADILNGTKFDGVTYIVGGAVRDYVMYNDIKDIDIVVELENGGIDLATWLDKNGYLSQKVVTYPTFGTAMFKLKEFPEYELEAVYTRGEKYTQGSRNPETCFASIKDDAFRRDLTINALYYNIKTGEIEDITGKGLDDIKNHIIRVTNDNPDIVFSDDPLRILRVIRFASRYGWEIEDSTYESMVKNANDLAIISQERITAEFNKMIMCDNPTYAMELINKTIDNLDLVCGFGEVLRSNIMSNYYFLYYSPVDLCTRIAILLIGNNTETVNNILRHMKYPNTIISEIEKIGQTNHLHELANSDLSSREKIYYTIAKEQYRCGNDESYNRLLAVFEHFCERFYNNTEAPYKLGKYSQYISMYEYKLPINGYDIMQILDCGPSNYVSTAKFMLLDYAFHYPNCSAYDCINYLTENKENIMKMKF